MFRSLHERLHVLFDLALGPQLTLAGIEIIASIDGQSVNTGNPVARAINVVHYRLAEARRLQAAGKATECQQAALEAVAVARGLPRWRQYVKLNINKWVAVARYRTRFDGILDEDTLFTTTANLGAEAEQVHAACGGPTGAPTTPAHEQSFHTCW